MTQRFFRKLWPEMRLGAKVTTRKQNKHQANGKLPILQKERRSDRFDQMLSSRWLVFLVLMELCTRNLFLLDRLWIDNFIWRCWKDYAIAYGKKTRNVEQRWFGPSPWQCPCPHGPECAAFFGKTQHNGYPSSSLFTWSCAMRLFPVPSYERPDEREMFCWCQRSEKEKPWRSWTISALKRIRNVFSSGKNVGTAVSSWNVDTAVSSWNVGTGVSSWYSCIELKCWYRCIELKHWYSCIELKH